MAAHRSTKIGSGAAASSESSSPRSPLAAFPRVRMRRNRQTGWLRALVSEHRLSISDLIWPIFVVETERDAGPVLSMPGVFRRTIAECVSEVRDASRLGIPTIALFPMIDPNRKTDDGREAWRKDNLVCRAITAIKAEVPNIGVLCDVALDPFTDHGHDGILDQRGRVDNDRTLEALCAQTMVQVEAGCDIIAPSDMMDGRVGRIRDELDEAGYEGVCIMSYAAKFSSCFYAPFRDAIGSAQPSGIVDKKSYQMDPANGDEALREVALDIAEGADMVMVKPGMPYLDVIWRIKQRFGVPTFAYQVSGEYAMLAGAVAQGWLDGERAMIESLLACKRAGADGVLTYFAREVAVLLRSEFA